MTLQKASRPATEPRRRVNGGSTLGHPSGLPTLAGVELWERLSFYGLQVILAYYIYFSVADGGLGLSQSQALAVAGAYGGGVYLTQPLGAWIADRLLPARTVVLLSGFVIVAGHIALAVVPQVPGLILGLGLITVGTGGLYPNVLAMLGSLYQDKPLKRDSGFSLFYTGILVGAFLGPVVTGFLQVHFGFHAAFLAAAVGMAIGLVIYLLRQKTLPAAATVVPHPIGRAGRRNALFGLILVVALIAVLVGTSMITLANINTAVLLVIGLVAAGYFVVMLRAKAISTTERRQVVAFLPIFIAAVVFWTMVLQLFTTFAVYAETRVDLGIGGIEIPPAYISIFQVIAGIIAGPVIAGLWQAMGSRQPRTGTKLIVGLVIMAAGYGVFAVIPMWSGALVNLVPVVLGMVLFGIAEVTFAPISFSAATQLAPRAFHSQMMALVGLSTAAGASLSGFVGQLYDAANEPLFFGSIAGCTLLAALLLFIMSPVLRRQGLE